MRLAVLDGTCPEILKISAECYTVHQAKDRCICWTQQTEELDNEWIDQEHVPPAKRARLIACSENCKIDGQCPGPGPWWEKDAGNPPKGCVIAAQPNVYETYGDKETALTIQLRAACAPCIVTGANWGRCPMCLVETGGCVAACSGK